MANWYIKVSSAWKQVNQAFFKSSSAWKEIQEGYIKESGVWKNFYTAFVATSFVNKTTPGTSTATVPDGANSIHIQAAVGGGAAGVDGADYDKAGGESGGTGGGSGAYISDKVFTVSEGETLTFTVGDGPSSSSESRYNQTAPSGTLTKLEGSTTGVIFNLGGGGGGSGTGGGVQGPLRTNNPSSGGSVSHIDSAITSGSFRESDGTSVTFGTATTLDNGPVGTFNQSGSGVAGVTGTNCSGDDCTVTGGNGGASYTGNISGGSGSTTSQAGSGSQGSGGGGGGAAAGPGSGNGGTGGDGEIKFRFLRVN